jgi:cystathionine beta-lyase family protein involved in aluminum resistance
MQISDKTRRLCEQAELELAGIFSGIDRISGLNTEHVLDCFREHCVSESMFAPSTGYGYGDRGRDETDSLVADIFRAESGFVRPSILSGTHALTVALFGVLRPGDVMLCITGKPYDTLLDVIGIGDGPAGEGSLRDWGVGYDCLELLEDGSIDTAGLREKIRLYGSRLRMVYVQRSRGYSSRPSLSVRQITEAAYHAKAFAEENGTPRPVFTVDNCYGEFTEEYEPSFALPGAEKSLGADLIIGSLIKNPGGGMADVGGYIAGREEYVRLCGNRLTCPGVGLDVGASLGQTRNILKGLFYAPHTVAQALKTAHLAAYMFGALGLEVSPGWREKRYDIVQTVRCGSGDALKAFCGGIQSGSPIDAYVTPVPWDMPGYPDEVIMAAGAFTGGSSIELSADGPMRPPYTAYMQGGLTYESARLAVMAAADRVAEIL